VRLPLALAVTVALAGCGGSDSPEQVVRGWSAALNAGDDEKAAGYFAKDARVVQGDDTYTLPTREAAEQFNAGIPCSGRILSVTVEGNEVTAVFLLGDRRRSRCDGPGQKATAVFEIEHGKIVLWHQIPPSAPQGNPS
jgi:limonene-1,2-epoxide hydrolase